MTGVKLLSFEDSILRVAPGTYSVCPCSLIVTLATFSFPFGIVNVVLASAFLSSPYIYMPTNHFGHLVDLVHIIVAFY